MALATHVDGISLLHIVYAPCGWASGWFTSDEKYLASVFFWQTYIYGQTDPYTVMRKVVLIKASPYIQARKEGTVQR